MKSSSSTDQSSLWKIIYGDIIQGTFYRKGTSKGILYFVCAYRFYLSSSFFKHYDPKIVYVHILFFQFFLYSFYICFQTVKDHQCCNPKIKAAHLNIKLIKNNYYSPYFPVS